MHRPWHRPLHFTALVTALTPTPPHRACNSTHANSTSPRPLAVYRNDDVLRRFSNVPHTWRFAAGGFGGKVRVLRDGEDPKVLAVPRLCVSKFAAFGLPPDVFSGPRLNTFVQLDLLDAEGKPVLGSHGGPMHLQTKSPSPHAPPLPGVEPPGPGDSVWDDELAFMLPESLSNGAQLRVTVWDDDEGKRENALGGTMVPIALGEGEVSHDHLQIRGFQPMPGGHTFADCQLSFSLEVKGLSVN